MRGAPTLDILAAILFPRAVWVAVNVTNEYIDIKKKRRRQEAVVWVVIWWGACILLLVPALKGYLFILIILGAMLGLLA